MFTGIIEEIGEIESINFKKLKINCKKVLREMNIGDSIATNGVCLTITNKGIDFFEAFVMEETLRKSNLGSLRQGAKVNLERAMRVNGRLNGHIVSGHIDGVGEIVNFKNEGKAIWITIKVDKKLAKYIVYKGSIAIDGVSLTVAEIKENIFKISIIPHTQEETILIHKTVNSFVNIECDVVSKYVEKLLRIKEKSNITEDLLIKNGFM